jgi:hypothetical protein
LRAGSQLGHERWFARAVDLVGFINGRMRRHDGAWRVSANADSSRVFSDVNAITVSAMLHAARLFGDDALGVTTLDTLEHVLLASYRPGEGIAHCGGGVRGLLTDQVAMAGAALDAWEAGGNIVYRMMAEELMHGCLRRMWDDDRGGFFDRDPAVLGWDPAGAARPLKPFVANCDAAVVLHRLSTAVDDGSFAGRAVDTLRSAGTAAAGQGVLAAHYLVARRAVLR